MTAVLPRVFRRQPVLDRLFRLVALFAWVGQLAVVGAMYLEASAGTNTAPHVESHSNPLHHAHNPELCPACAALALVGRPEPTRPAIGETEIVHAQPEGAEPSHGARSLVPSARPRAPPVRELIRSSLRFTSHSQSWTIHAFRTLAVRAPGERRGHCTRAAA